MADYDRRPRRGGGNFNNRKRRYHDDWEDRRQPQRRRYEEPIRVTLRKKLLGIGEGPVLDGPPHERRPDQKAEEQVADIAKIVADNYFDSDLTGDFTNLLLQMLVEQPLKIPFLAAVILIANTQKPEYTQEILKQMPERLQKLIDNGCWREVKFYLRFLGSLQGMWEGDGVFPILDQLFNKAVELQTNSSDDTLGLELVKIILLTIPYTLASSATGFADHANTLIEKTDIIASIPHALETLVDPFPSMQQGAPTSHESALALLQKHMQSESKNNWELSCLPRPWKMSKREDEEDMLPSAQKHPFPTITFPHTLQIGPRSIFPEIYFSIYSDQELDTVPPTTDASAIIMRDALNDTINSLDFSRGMAAKFLVDVDRYFGNHTFVPRGTQFDKLKDIAGDRVMFKPEDVAVDAVFAQLFTLPAPEHKLVYYHAVLTETCKLAPQFVAPSLGRAIRYLYRNVERMDLELSERFLDWFAHHLSNFGFTWKWTEWTADLDLPDVHPRKAFIGDALDKEIRLSFAQRIKGTLPEEYKPLITARKEQDTPDFKFADEQALFAAEGKELSQLIRKKAPDEDFAPVIEKIETDAVAQGRDAKMISTDVLVTAITYVGAKSLSHFLAIVERCRERLLAIANGDGDGARGRMLQKQIITSVMAFWRDQKGTGVNIVNKLLNYEVVSPEAVVEWVLGEKEVVRGGEVLSQAWAMELVEKTAMKVAGRVKAVVAAMRMPTASEEKREELKGVLEVEMGKMKGVFGLIQGCVGKLLLGNGVEEGMMEADGLGEVEGGLVRVWGAKWAKAWARRATVQEAWIREELKKPLPPPPPAPSVPEPEAMEEVKMDAGDEERGGKRVKVNGDVGDGGMGMNGAAKMGNGTEGGDGDGGHDDGMDDI